MAWIKLIDKYPIVEEVGEKILLYRIMNDSQERQAITIHETRMVKHCNPEETWWMQLPCAPSAGANADLKNANCAIFDVSQRSELLAFKQFISKTPQAELEYYSDEEFIDLYLKANCG